LESLKRSLASFEDQLSKIPKSANELTLLERILAAATASMDLATVQATNFGDELLAQTTRVNALRKAIERLAVVGGEDAALVLDVLTGKYKAQKAALDDLRNSQEAFNFSLELSAASADIPLQRMREVISVIAQMQVTLGDFSLLALDSFNQLASGIGDAVAAAIISGENLEESLLNVLTSVAEQIISALITLGIQQIAFSLIQQQTASNSAGSSVGASAATGFAAAFASVIAALPFPLNVAVAPGVAAGVSAGIVGGAAIAGISGQGVGRAVALAEGGIVTSPTNAIIGEGREPEAVFPLSQLEKFIDINSGSGSTTVVVELDGRQVAKAVVPQIPGVVRSRGVRGL
jgi:hypothetical protein